MHACWRRLEAAESKSDLQRDPHMMSWRPLGPCDWRSRVAAALALAVLTCVTLGAPWSSASAEDDPDSPPADSGESSSDTLGGPHLLAPGSDEPGGRRQPRTTSRGGGEMAGTPSPSAWAPRGLDSRQQPPGAKALDTPAEWTRPAVHGGSLVELGDPYPNSCFVASSAAGLRSLVTHDLGSGGKGVGLVRTCISGYTTLIFSNIRCLGGPALTCAGRGDQGDLPLKEGSAGVPAFPPVREEATATPPRGALRGVVVRRRREQACARLGDCAAAPNWSRAATVSPLREVNELVMAGELVVIGFCLGRGSYWHSSGTHFVAEYRNSGSSEQSH